MAVKIADTRGAGKAINTVGAYRDRAQWLEPILGSVKVQDLTAAHIQKARDTLSAKFKPSTARATMSFLSTTLEWAMKRGYVLRNVAKLVDNVKAPNPEWDWYSVDEMHALDGALKQEDSPVSRYNQVQLAIPVRGQSELRPLLWRDTDLDGSHYSLTRVSHRGVIVPAGNSKGKRRQIPIPARIVPVFEAQRAWQWRERQQRATEKRTWLDADGLVWTNEKGEMLTVAQVKYGLEQAMKRAGLRILTYHQATRHSPASGLLAIGVHPKKVQEILGHNKISQTMDTYAHVMPGQTLDALDQLGAAVTTPSHRSA